MIPLARSGLSDQQIIRALHAATGSRNVRFIYKLLDNNNRVLRDLSNVTGGKVTHAAFSDIKRRANFSIVDDGSIDFLSDRIQPIYEILIKGQWVPFPLGVFLLATPKKTDGGLNITRDIEAYDGLLILIDDKIDEPWTVTTGTNYKAAVIDLLVSAGITQHIISDTDKTLAIDQVFEMGASKLEIINALLSQINYTPIRVDVNGNFVSSAYQAPNSRGIEYTYKDDFRSVTYKGVMEELDLFSVPNKWIVVTTNAEEAPLKSVYINENPNNPTSTVSRGRTITDYREIDNIADQQALDSYVMRLAHEANQVYGKIEFDTAIMPHHDYMDLLQIEYSALGISDRFTETDWSFALKAGEKMRHSARRVIEI